MPRPNPPTKRSAADGDAARAHDHLVHLAGDLLGADVARAGDASLQGLGDAAEICINNGRYLRRVEGRVIDLFVRSTFLGALLNGRKRERVLFWKTQSSEEPKQETG